MRTTTIALFFWAVCFGSFAGDRATEDPAPKNLALYLDEPRLCGPVVAFVALSYHDLKADLSELVTACALSEQGTSIQTLAEVLEDHGLRSVAFRGGPKDVRSLKTPFIATLQLPEEDGRLHFVFVASVEDDEVLMIDGSKQAGLMSFPAFFDQFAGTGIALLPPQDRIGRAIDRTGRFLEMLALLLAAAVSIQLVRARLRNARMATVLAALAIASSSPAGTAPAFRPASASFALPGNSDFDYGDCLLGETIQHRFLITNKGASELRLKVLSRSCTCAETELEDQCVPAGKSTYLRLQLAAKDTRGKQTARVAVGVENAEPSMVVFTMTYVVRAPFMLSRKTLDVGALGLGGESTHRAEIQLDKKFILEQLTVDTGCPWIQGRIVVSLQNPVTPSKDFYLDRSNSRVFLELVVRPSLDLVLKPWKKTVRVTCAGEKVHSEEPVLSGSFTGRTSLVPPYLVVGPGQTGGRVQVQAGGPAPVKRLEALQTPQGFTSAVEPVVPGGASYLRFSLSLGQNPTSESQALVRVSYGDAHVETVELPILVLGKHQ